MQVRKMRLFRLKYQITRKELGQACGLSPQRISEIELDPAPMLNAETKEKLEKAFETVVERRRGEWTELYQTFAYHRDTLTNAVEETAYEL